MHAYREKRRVMGKPDKNNINITNNKMGERRNNDTNARKPRTEPDEVPPQKKRHTDDGKRKQMWKQKETTQREQKSKTARKQLSYEVGSKTLIKMENGIRAMNIDSLNPDSMQEERANRDITKDLNRNKIRISSIQETHIAQCRNYLLGK